MSWIEFSPLSNDICMLFLQNATFIKRVTQSTHSICMLETQASYDVCNFYKMCLRYRLMILVQPESQVPKFLSGWFENKLRHIDASYQATHDYVKHFIFEPKNLNVGKNYLGSLQSSMWSCRWEFFILLLGGPTQMLEVSSVDRGSSQTSSSFVLRKKEVFDESFSNLILTGVIFLFLKSL